MIITAIEQQKRNKNRLSIFIDGGYAFGMERLAFGLLGLRVSDELSAKELEEIKATAVVEDAKGLALRYLSRQPRTAGEVMLKLKGYDIDEDVILAVLDFLKEYRYVDDTAYSGKYIEQKRRAGYGDIRIKGELIRKGVKRDIVDSVFSELAEEMDDEDDAVDETGEIILNLLRRRIKSESREEFDKKERQRIYNFLNSRGFSYDDAKAAVRMYWEGD